MPLPSFTAALVAACAPEAPPAPPTGPPLAAEAPPTAALATYREMWADAQAARSPADGAGEAAWHPDVHPEPPTLTAGAPATLVVQFRSAGIAPNGSLTVAPDPFWGWSPPQTHRPDAPGYTAVSTAAEVVTEVFGGQLRAVFPRGLPAGDVVEVRWTGLADRFAEARSPFAIGVDGDGDGVRAWLAQFPTARVRPGPAARLWLTVPTTAAPGAPMRLTVAALDAAANRAELDGDVALHLPPGWTGPATVPIVDGVGRATLTAPADGLGAVVGTIGALEGRSNPALIRADAPRILWADLQIHTAGSDGTGEVDDALAYARDVAGLDVAAVTDHDRWGLRYLDADPAAFATQAAAAAAARRDDFLAVPGYEWTSWVFGHRHVLFFDRPGPIVSALSDAGDTPEELRAAFRGRDVVIVPHHPAGGPVALDWRRGLDPTLEPVVEVVSVHGQSESPTLPHPIRDGRAWVADALQGGHRAGLIGSTDGHDGHPGLAHLVGPTGGLTALIDAAPTPEAVLAALRARRVYATSGPRILLRVDVDGHPMGAHLPPGPGALTVRILGTTDLVGADIVTRSGAQRLGADGPALLHRATVPGAPGDLLYVRVVQADGGMAWSSPITWGPP